MTEIAIEISENVTAALDAAIAFGQDQSDAMASIAVMLSAFTKRNFIRQSSPLGVPWAPRKTLPGKEPLTHPILRLSGDLFESIREDFGPDFAAAGPEASGGAAVYARIHQLGGTIKPRPENTANVLNTPFGFLRSVTMPARPYAGWNDEMEQRTLAILGEAAVAAYGQGQAL